jgi:hypothetical protein
MTLKKDQRVSAQVVLRAASGKSPHAAAITAATIEEFLPSPQTVAAAVEQLAAAGFDTGPVVGNSLAITAPIRTFEAVFRTRLRQREGGGIESVARDGSAGFEIPLSALPRTLAVLLTAVTFTPPPDFGPTGFNR